MNTLSMAAHAYGPFIIEAARAREAAAMRAAREAAAMVETTRAAREAAAMDVTTREVKAYAMKQYNHPRGKLDLI
jgi:hypothetical protein